MNLFKSISNSLMVLWLFGFLFFALSHALSVTELGLVIGVWLVLSTFKAALTITEFEMRYSKAIGAVDEAEDSLVDGEAVKKDGVWL